MKILLVSNKNNQFLGSHRIYIENLFSLWKGQGVCVETSEVVNSNADVVIFHKGISLKEIDEFALNSEALIGVIHPDSKKISRKKRLRADFAIVGSLPEQDFYRKFLEEVFIFPQIELFFTKVKNHTDNNEIIFSYHGNKDHLENLSLNLVKALEEFSKEKKIKLKAIYNLKSLGIWKKNRPNIEIMDLQWALTSLEEELLSSDIGICPGLIKASSLEKKLFFKLQSISALFKLSGSYESDYLIRFKNTTNNGRAAVFHQLGIPVVADFSPTNFIILGNQENGYLAHSKEAWLKAFRKLSESAEHRRTVALNAKTEYQRLFDAHKWASNLYLNIKNLRERQIEKRRIRSKN